MGEIHNRKTGQKFSVFDENRLLAISQPIFFIFSFFGSSIPLDMRSK